MIYELEITDEKAKSIIAFLKQLDFVKVKLYRSPAKKKAKNITNKKNHKNLSYFNACPDWDVEASTLRHGGSDKRVKGW